MQKLFVCAVATGAVLSCTGTDAVAQPTNPLILCHPETQVVRQGTKKVTFRVTVDDPSPPYACSPFTYHWERKGPWATNYLTIGSATDDTYTISNVSTNDVAFYRVQVSSTNGTSTSEPAQLLVYTKHSPLTVYGSPVVSSGGSGDCPGPYVAYVNYRKSVSQGWGWVADHGVGNTTHSATDINFNDTKVQAVGPVNDNFCQPTSVPNTHAGSPAPEDITNRFTIYFTNIHSSPNPYPITLNGYKP